MLYELLITSHLKRNTVALTDTVEDFDYKQIDSICGKISTALRNMGICCGERVVVIAEKKYQLFSLCFRVSVQEFA